TCLPGKERTRRNPVEAPWGSIKEIEVAKKSRLHPIYLLRDAYRYGGTALESRRLRRDEG
ncbi:MAG: hypothetical protein KJ002_13055, partial [Candidatus Dadabacteria bacterium]|nr:hypothetical protein [Candidatus Dadabacteria bacterium]